jgi:hypothetical protein
MTDRPTSPLAELVRQLRDLSATGQRATPRRSSSPPGVSPEEPPFEPLVSVRLKPVLGALVAGVFIGALVVVASAPEFLRKSSAAPATAPTIIMPAKFAPLPIRSPGVLGPIVQGQVGTFDAQGVTFDYPENWQNMTRVVAGHPPHGHAMWSAVLGTGQDQVAIVGAYPGADPGSDAGRGRQATLIAQDVAEQLGATFADRAGNVGARPLPTFNYSIIGASLDGRPPWRIDAFVVFGRQARYVVQCQALGADSMDFGRGCARIISTFRPTEPLLGAGSPLEAAQALYKSAKAGRADLAHRVATDDAAKELRVWDPEIKPPTECFVSDGASGQLCGARNAGLFSVEFEVAQIGDMWIVTHVFRCTQYGSDVICRTFGP